ncbi:MAG: hypothetical protein LBL95_08645 [Deltaproteobacteria bacterium]|jgi:hypothetical protein|nr:hypothetical protein [Deltaproteobacteria bacterium]
MSKGPKKTPAASLFDRLECFGTYEPGDQVCRRGCALAISCALAQGEILDGQVLDADPRPRPVPGPHGPK